MATFIRTCLSFFLAAVLLLCGGCYHLKTVDPAQGPALYLVEGGAGKGAVLAPAFFVHNDHVPDNRIGSPKAAYDENGLEVVTMDPESPAVYYEKRGFKTKRSEYVNHIYRVHFVGTPASLFPFFISAGSNMGLLVIITCNLEGTPLLVATVGSCGCYISLTPTKALARDMLPQDWTGQPLEIYGETLPALLDLGPGQRLVVEIRPGEHRVMGLRLMNGGKPVIRGAGAIKPAPLRPMSDLERIPLNGGNTSLFYKGGLLDGHVKGAWKPWETLLMGIWSLDMMVGMDKAYGYEKNPFYTSLKFWAREESDMNNYAGFLRYWGWRL